MGIPQLIVIVLYVLGLGISMAKHGQPIDANHSFFLKLFSTAVMLGLLIWGGFFK
jgi:hypothetical protein